MNGACDARGRRAGRARPDGARMARARGARVPARLMRDKVHAYGEKLKGTRTLERLGPPWRMQTHFSASTRAIRISKGG